MASESSVMQPWDTDHISVTTSDTQKRSPIFGVPATAAAGKQVLAILSLKYLLVYALTDVQVGLSPTPPLHSLKCITSMGVTPPSRPEVLLKMKIDADSLFCHLP